MVGTAGGKLWGQGQMGKEGARRRHCSGTSSDKNRIPSGRGSLNGRGAPEVDISSALKRQLLGLSDFRQSRMQERQRRLPLNCSAKSAFSTSGVNCLCLAALFPGQSVCL